MGLGGDGVIRFIIQILYKLKMIMITRYKYQDQLSFLLFFLNYIPLTDLLFPHKLIKYEVIKHSLGIFSPVIDITAPPKEKKRRYYGTQDFIYLFGR
jgi:hypothetical protein